MTGERIQMLTKGNLDEYCTLTEFVDKKKNVGLARRLKLAKKKKLSNILTEQQCKYVVNCFETNNKYNDFEYEMLNILTSVQFKKYMSELNAEEFSMVDFLDLAQRIYCEDLASYLYFKYKAEVINLNNMHFIVKYKSKYYDSKTLAGVKNIEDIPYVNRIDIRNLKQLPWTVRELPEYYFNAAKAVGLI